MTEKGKIREIRDKTVIVIPDMSASCFGCMNHECKSQGGLITAENSKALPLETGQIVEVKSPAGLVGQALAAFLPPVLGFLAGYFLAPLLFPDAGQKASAGLGLIFLFGTAFIIYSIRKKRGAKQYNWQIVRIVE